MLWTVLHGLSTTYKAYGCVELLLAIYSSPAAAAISFWVNRTSITTAADYCSTTRYVAKAWPDVKVNASMGPYSGAIGVASNIEFKLNVICAAIVVVELGICIRSHMRCVRPNGSHKPGSAAPSNEKSCQHHDDE